MNPELRALILALCDETDNIVANNDWPTEDGSPDEDGNCLITERNAKIRNGLDKIP